MSIHWVCTISFHVQTLSWTFAPPSWASQVRWCMSPAPFAFTMPPPGSLWTWWPLCPLTCCMPSTSQWWVPLLITNMSRTFSDWYARSSRDLSFSLLALLPFSTSDLLGPPAEDSSSAAPPPSPSEAGPLLPVQRHGTDLTNVCVCPAGTLDGLYLVHDWTQGDWDQRELGHRWVSTQALLKCEGRVWCLIQRGCENNI